MVAARPDKGIRPSTQRRVNGSFTRTNYINWVRRFRARRSDKTFVIRPQTYRMLFKKAIGMEEPQYPVPSQGVEKTTSAEERETTTQEDTHAEKP